MKSGELQPPAGEHEIEQNQMPIFLYSDGAMVSRPGIIAGALGEDEVVLYCIFQVSRHFCPVTAYYQYLFETANYFNTLDKAGNDFVQKASPVAF